MVDGSPIRTGTGTGGTLPLPVLNWTEFPIQPFCLKTLAV